MDVTISESGEVNVVRIGGNLDTESFPEAQAQVTQLIEQGARKILVDLKELVYISVPGPRRQRLANGSGREVEGV